MLQMTKTLLASPTRQALSLRRILMTSSPTQLTGVTRRLLSCSGAASASSPEPAQSPSQEDSPRKLGHVSPAAAKTPAWLGKAFYLSTMGGAVFLLPYINLFLRQLGATDAQIGVLCALRPWLAITSTFVGPVLADRYKLHREVLVTAFFLSTLLRSTMWLVKDNVYQVAALLLLADLVGGPVGPMADSMVLASCKKESDYGRQRLWGSVGWGLFAPLAGLLVGQAGIGAGFTAYTLLFIPAFVVTAQLRFPAAASPAGFPQAADRTSLADLQPQDIMSPAPQASAPAGAPPLQLPADSPLRCADSRNGSEGQSHVLHVVDSHAARAHGVSESASGRLVNAVMDLLPSLGLRRRRITGASSLGSDAFHISDFASPRTAIELTTPPETPWTSAADSSNNGRSALPSPLQPLASTISDTGSVTDTERQTYTLARTGVDDSLSKPQVSAAAAGTSQGLGTEMERSVRHMKSSGLSQALLGLTRRSMIDPLPAADPASARSSLHLLDLQTSSRGSSMARSPAPVARPMDAVKQPTRPPVPTSETPPRRRSSAEDVAGRGDQCLAASHLSSALDGADAAAMIKQGYSADWHTPGQDWPSCVKTVAPSYGNSEEEKCDRDAGVPVRGTDAEDNSGKVTASGGSSAPSNEFWSQLSSLLAQPAVWRLLFQALASGFGAGLVGTYQLLYANDIGVGASLMGFMLTANCLAETPAFYYQAQLLQWASPTALLHLSLGAMVLRLLLYASLPCIPGCPPWAILPIELLQGLTLAVAWGSICVLCKQLAPPGMHTTLQGTATAVFGGVGGGLGGLVGGLLRQANMGWSGTWTSASALVILLWGASVLLVPKTAPEPILSSPMSKRHN